MEASQCEGRPGAQGSAIEAAHDDYDPVFDRAPDLSSCVSDFLALSRRNVFGENAFCNRVPRGERIAGARGARDGIEVEVTRPPGELVEKLKNLSGQAARFEGEEMRFVRLGDRFVWVPGDVNMGDSVAGDGLYSAIVRSTDTGEMSVKARLTALLSTGETVVREATAGIAVNP